MSNNIQNTHGNFQWFCDVYILVNCFGITALCEENPQLLVDSPYTKGPQFGDLMFSFVFMCLGWIAVEQTVKFPVTGDALMLMWHHTYMYMYIYIYSSSIKYATMN